MCIIYQCFIKKKVIIESHHVWWSSSGRRLGDLEPWVTGPWGSGTCRHDRCGGGASWPPGGAAAPRQATLARPPRSPAGGAQGCAASLLGGSCPHGPFPEPASREHAKAAGGSRGSDAAQVLQPPPRGPSPPAAGWGRSSPAGADAVRGPGQALSTSLSDLGATLSATAWKVAGSVRRAPPPRAGAATAPLVTTAKPGERSCAEVPAAGGDAPRLTNWPLQSCATADGLGDRRGRFCGSCTCSGHPPPGLESALVLSLTGSKVESRRKHPLTYIQVFKYLHFTTPASGFIMGKKKKKDSKVPSSPLFSFSPRSSEEAIVCP